LPLDVAELAQSLSCLALVWLGVTNRYCAIGGSGEGGGEPVLRGDRRVEVSGAPLGVGGADAARDRRRRAGLPARRRAAAADRDGRGPRGDRRNPGGQKTWRTGRRRSCRR